MEAYNWDIICSFLCVFGLFWLSNMSLWYSLSIWIKKKLKNFTLKKAIFQGHLKLAYFVISYFSDFWSQLPSKSSKCKKLGMLGKIQENWSKMGTRIYKIDEEMSDAKVGNSQNSTSKKWANPDISHFRIIFSKKKLIPMAIIGSQKSTKTTRKLLKMSHI